jgi:hypothetical protein
LIGRVQEQSEGTGNKREALETATKPSRKAKKRHAGALLVPAFLPLLSFTSSLNNAQQQQKHRQQNQHHHQHDRLEKPLSPPPRGPPTFSTNHVRLTSSSRRDGQVDEEEEGAEEGDHLLVLWCIRLSRPPSLTLLPSSAPLRHSLTAFVFFPTDMSFRKLEHLQRHERTRESLPLLSPVVGVFPSTKEKLAVGMGTKS